jgi:hypothetical protein
MTFYIEKNFITEQERLDVKQRVLALRDLWDFYSNNTSHGMIYFQTLGNALYLMEASELPSDSINIVVKQTLIENFDWLYQRICTKVSDITGRPTQLHPTLTVPGFHIGDVAGDYKIDYFHVDGSITTYDRESVVATNTVYSVLIPIEMPRSGAGLQYLEKGQEKRLEYELSAFYQWKGDLEHKIGDSLLLPDEQRITLQCHYYYNNTQDVNYVYF